MKRSLGQESLKIIASLAMLIDHVGVVFLPWIGFRIIGRISFPIFCFLLCEGAEHTRSPIRYAVRLAVGALIAELPFDYLFYGGVDLTHSNVMVTLLLGLPVVLCVKRCPKPQYWLVAIIGSVALAELLGADYGGVGVLMIAAFALPAPPILRLLVMALLSLAAGGPVQIFALLAFVPIWNYSGEKATASKVVKMMFYLFYPVHMAVLLLLQKICLG